jgi:nucleotide-binding universal stress UspA family protein
MPSIALRRILVPTDFSETSAAAVKYAVALADAFGAELHLLHVMERPIELQMAAEIALVSGPEIEAEVRTRAETALHEVLTRDEREKYRAVDAIEAGSPFAAIVQYARTANVDLIVMGTHGRGAVAHLLIGSVAENVVRKAPCPVLTIPTRGHDFVTI